MELVVFQATLVVFVLVLVIQVMNRGKSEQRIPPRETETVWARAHVSAGLSSLSGRRA